MATAAFKSTTKRTLIGASSTSSTDASSSSNRSSSANRRSRSLSRFSHRIASEDTYNDLDEFPPRRGKFVNTVRGSGFPEISLDDLAIEFFESGNRGRSASGHSEVSPASASAIAVSSQRRGRSVSRKSSGVSNDGRGNVGTISSGGGKAVSETNPRRRRSVSVVRYQISDSESDLEQSKNSRSRVNLKSVDTGNKQMHKPAASNQRPVLRRSLSQKDMRSYDGYSSHSSVLTDDEGAAAHFNKNGVETIGAVYVQKKAMHPNVDNGLYKATRKELRQAADDIKLEIEQDVVKPKITTLPSGDRLRSKSSDVTQAASSIRRNYESKLEQSEKRRQDLLAEIVLEEQRGRELSKIVNKLLPDTKNNAIETPPRARKRSNDRNRMSKCLTEEAERYIEDFISNVEDTDISSLDGERSDTSSSIGGLFKPETFNTPPIARSLPVEMDGVALPWLQWETSNDPSTCQSKTEMLVTPKTAHSNQEIAKAHEQSNHSVSSRGSWSPDGLPPYVGKDLIRKIGESNCESFSAKSKGLRYDVDEYLTLKSNEDFVIETWRQRHRINSGSLLLCNLKLF
ncbi:hypothetical protein L6164_014829 [Bauhinia variegata]|uniref:Uncharacterized protein n=1 Tax=Bauhinia variegata TaxID=167791 RepID=A0ACB9NJG7_BAUVA|nr:hypothetical protein L6164_014829 [Bauhinia variegata]